MKKVVQSDVAHLSGVEDEQRSIDACFFCLGVSSSGMSETAYRKITRDLTLAVAKTLARLNPALTFISVSGTELIAALRPNDVGANKKRNGE